jgi:hypothetical protein
MHPARMKKVDISVRAPRDPTSTPAIAHITVRTEPHRRGAEALPPLRQAADPQEHAHQDAEGACALPLADTPESNPKLTWPPGAYRIGNTSTRATTRSPRRASHRRTPWAPRSRALKSACSPVRTRRACSAHRLRPQHPARVLAARGPPRRHHHHAEQQRPSLAP